MPKAKAPRFLVFGVVQQVLFAKRLGMMLRSGLPLMECLRILASQRNSRSAGYIYLQLQDTIARGAALSSGLQNFKQVFSDFSINIVRVGEASGTLHENLEYLAQELKKKYTLRRTVIGAMIYPAVIVAATLGITLLLTLYIFPKITPIFQSIQTELPPTTRALIAISAFLSHSGWWLLLGVIAGSIALIFIMRIPRMHLMVDLILVRIPVIGATSRNYNCANIARTLGLLIKSDVPIMQAVELVAASTNNWAYRRTLLTARSRIMRGQTLSAELKDYPHLFPVLFTQMVATGEHSGNLPTALSYLAAMYEEEVGELAKNLAQLLEPILMIVMGIIVGFIAISIITPIYGITQHLGTR